MDELSSDMCGMDADQVLARERRVSWHPSGHARVQHRLTSRLTESPSSRGLVYEVFEAQVKRTPDAIALVHGRSALTYLEIDARANTLAEKLIRCGVGADTLVAIHAPRGFDAVIGLIAVLKAGGAYVPLDPSYPASRLQQMLNSARPKVLLLQGDRGELTPPPTTLILALDCAATADVADRDRGTAVRPALSPTNLVYVIYTSGSTGQPKGTEMPHGAVGNLIEWHRRHLPLEAGQRVLQFAALSFDVAFQEVLTTLAAGGALVLVDEWIRKDPRELTQLLAREAVDRIFVPPLVLQSLAEVLDDGTNLRLSVRDIISAGEQLRITPEIRRWAGRLPGCRLHNHYGPTETHVVTALTLSNDPDQWPTLPSIGSPIDNSNIYILDDERHPVAVGEKGEIYIGGVGVARGYRARAELTAERFIADPLSDDGGVWRFYRTGDFGRYCPDGTIEYFGRNDFQIKLRGFRIELEEIESRLRDVDTVSEAVVVVREDFKGLRRLIAYVKPGNQAQVDTESLRSHLKASLPEYMVPAAFVVLERFPLTPNGKLDRQALPIPDIGAAEIRDIDLPTGEMEELLAKIWRDILRVEHIGRNDNFFEVGGDSLLVFRVSERLRERGLVVEIPRLFSAATLADLAQELSGKASGLQPYPENRIPPGSDRITPGMLTLVQLDQNDVDRIAADIEGGAPNIQDIYPLIPMQEGLLFHYLAGGEHAVDPYARHTLLRFPSRERRNGFVSALQRVVDRHDILRTSIIWEKLPSPVQVVHRRALLEVRETHCNAMRSAKEIYGILSSTHHRLDIRRAPLIKLSATDVEGGESYLLLTLHHMICDQVTVSDMVTEIVFYLRHPDGRLPDAGAFRSHVAQLYARSESRDADEFFHEKLGDITETAAPWGVMEVRVAGDQDEAVERLPRELSRRIRLQASRLRVSAATLFHAAWGLVVSRASSRDDVVYGTVLIGRIQQQTTGGRVLGMFINTLPLRLCLGDVTVSDLVERTRQGLVELLSHESTSLARAQRCAKKIRGTSPLFTSVLNYRQHEAGELSWSNIDNVSVLQEWERTNYPIVLSVDSSREDFVLTAQADARIGAERILEYTACALRALVDALEERLPRPVRTLDVLPESERTEVLGSLSGVEAAPLEHDLIDEAFEAQARMTPEAAALIGEVGTLTYAEVSTRTTRLAEYLRHSGCATGECVAMVMARSALMVMVQLAILKSGNTYVPIDPQLPLERQSFIIRDCKATLVISDRDPPGDGTTTVRWLRVTSDMLESQAVASRRNRPDTRMITAAYVMYTSGSTGIPKGVIVSHGSVIRLAKNTYVRLGGEHRLTHCSNPVFDASTFEVWGAWLNGASVTVVAEDIVLDPARFAALIHRDQITTLWLTSGLFMNYANTVPDVYSGLTHLLTGGDVVDVGSVGRVLRGRAPRSLINAYGPTECTTFTTTYPVDSIGEDATKIPIGRPINGARVYLLSTRMQPVPVGATGEIYVGGSGVALGYLNRPDMTAQKFVANPFSGVPGERLYRTGDLGQWNSDGVLEFIGRNDTQVKIRGYRIEPGEIESLLSKYQGIQGAHVHVRNVVGEKRLIAYLVAYQPAGQDGTRAEHLRGYLKTHLPDYMIPSAFVFLDEFPVTANGKVDRKALPEPQQSDYSEARYEAPRGELEEILAAIWQSLLRLERVGRQDNFFELGGHSLLIMRALERLRRIGISANVRDFFENPTLTALAARLEGGAGVGTSLEIPPSRIPTGCTAITPQMVTLVSLNESDLRLIANAVPGGAANIEDILPLSPLQEGFLFHHASGGSRGDAYILATVLEVTSQGRLKQLLNALQREIDRHDIFRTAIVWEGLPQPVQVVVRKATLPIELLTLESNRDAVTQVMERIRPEQQRMNLTAAPLMRVQVAPNSAGDQWYAILQVHHMICDHVSIEAVVAEVVNKLEGRSAPEGAYTPYRVHVARAVEYGKSPHVEEYFSRKFGDVTEPTAPFGLLDVQGDGSRVLEYQELLSPGLAARVRLQARRSGVSAATLFHAAWGIVVAKTSGCDEAIFGTVLLGRLQGDAQRAIGMLINTLPIRVRLTGKTATQLVEEVQRELVESLGHEQASLSQIQRFSGVRGTTPLITTLFNFRHSDGSSFRGWEAASGIRILADQDRTSYPLVMSIDDFGDRFLLVSQTDRSLDPQRVGNYLKSALDSLMSALENLSDVPAATLQILTLEERERLVRSSSQPLAALSQGVLAHEVFAGSALRAAEAIAVVCDHQSLSYGELDERANALAHYLRKKGVGPEVIVGLIVERSLDMIVGVLGILKAGGAYLPLDPSYPSARVQYILTDAKPRIVLADSHTADLVSAANAEIVVLDEAWPEIVVMSRRPVDSVEVGLRPENLAYIIYTSGSTGNPKGVSVEHRNVTRLFAATEHWLRFDSRDVWSQFHSIAFDFSVWEIWGALLYGGRVVIVPSLVARAPQEFYKLIRGEGVTILSQTPSAFLQLTDAQAMSERFDHCLRAIIFGGEALELRTLQPWVSRNGADRPVLINMYGITETTVHVTYRRLSAEDIAAESGSLIGVAIPDLKVYVLDKYKQPVPIGVIGEMYVGGAGVARGYLNRPELAAERFISDPYDGSTDARLYKTGDLARRHADGTLEYLGRNDHQVKIRGYRIELGEIEARLGSHSGVKQAVVCVREDLPGDKRLVAYVVPDRRLNRDSNLNSESLRAHVKRALPEYMVPGAVVLLENMPLTEHGKLDRRALPSPDQATYESDRYEAPINPYETVVANLWKELVHVERVGRNDHFFEIGGHSVLALRLLFGIKERLGISLSVTDIYRNPVLRDLAHRLSAGDLEEEFVDLAREAVLDERIVPLSQSVRERPRAILLTGATGFVGRFVLAELVRETNATLYCLVRGESSQQAGLRLRASLSRWDLWKPEMEDRVVAISGDLAAPRLGVDEEIYLQLAEQVDRIYHCATSMNHLESYEMAKPANVGGITELLRLATLKNPMLLNHVSTLSVFGRSSQKRVVSEDSAIDNERHPRSEGYAASKWVGEKLVMEATRRGVPCNIFRLGLVWADSAQGRYDELQREYRLIKSGLLSGYGIRDYRYDMPPTPVDYITRAIVFLGERHREGSEVFHLSASRQAVNGGVFERLSHVTGADLDLKPHFEWVSHIKRLHDSGRTLPVVPLIQPTFSMDEDEFHKYQQIYNSGDTRFECDHTQRELDQAGIVAPVFDDALLDKFVTDLLTRDAEVQGFLDDERWPIAAGR